MKLHSTISKIALVASLLLTSFTGKAGVYYLTNTSPVAVRVQLTEPYVVNPDPARDIVLNPGSYTVVVPPGINYEHMLWINGAHLRGSVWYPLAPDGIREMTGTLDNGQLITLKKWSGVNWVRVSETEDYIDFKSIWIDAYLEIKEVGIAPADTTRFGINGVALGGNSKQCPVGMAGYSFNALHASLTVSDTPLFYSPPVGHDIAFTFSYDQRDLTRGTNVNFSNAGPNWNLSSISYVEDDPNSLTNSVQCFLQGGGSEIYNGFSGTISNSLRHPASAAILNRVATDRYERLFPDGSREVFNYSTVLPNGQRRIFLTVQSDPFSNTVSYTYETIAQGVRLIQVSDAINQASTLQYQHATDPLKITSIQDPFGHTVWAGYTNSSGIVRLASLTDPVNIISRFTYSGDFLKTLSTPYGTTTFNTSETASMKAIEATDPLGATERLEVRAYEPNFSQPSIPSKLTGGNHKINNSYYWDARALSRGSNDVTRAQIIHWATVGGKVTGIPLWTKQALEQPVVAEYPGQTNSFGKGITLERPNLSGRTLDGGAIQTNRYFYDSFGNVTNFTDTKGRSTTFVYSTDGIDLLEVRQKTSATTYDVLASMAYDRHLPVVTVSAGITNRFGFNPRGQLLSITNGLNEVTTFNYDSLGFLTNITGHLPEDSTSIAYDAAGRVFTITDPDGYTVTNSYDNLNRLIKRFFPDGTSVEMVHNRLDVGKVKGRDNRWTHYTYEAPARLTDIQDPLGRLIHFSRCSCGDLEGIMDPLGNYTAWEKDDAGRTRFKAYANRMGPTFTYETNSSRLASVFTKPYLSNPRFSYNTDDSTAVISNQIFAESFTVTAFNYSTVYPRLTSIVQDRRDFVGQGTEVYAFGYVPAGQPGAGSLASISSAASFPILYTNDVIGRLSSGRVGSTFFKVQYDPLGRIYWSSNNQGVTTATYDGASSRIKTLKRPNGITTVYGYSAVSNGSQLQFIWHTNQSGQTISRYDYCRDAVGRITAITNLANGTTTNWSYEYSPVGQLLGAAARTTNGTVTQRFRYTYDDAGNRISSQSNSAALAESVNNLNQLIGISRTNSTVRVAGYLSEPGTALIGGAAARMTSATNFEGEIIASTLSNSIVVIGKDFSGNASTNQKPFTLANAPSGTVTYDGTGNPEQRLGLQFTWTPNNRCERIFKSGVIDTGISYDAFGHVSIILELDPDRIRVTNSVRYFKWEGNRLAEEQNAAGTVIRRYFPGGFWFNGNNYFYLTDHLGSVREVVNSSGTVVARFTYDPYGRRTRLSGTLQVDIGFTGHFHHEPSGLIFAPFRIYDPNTGRWLSRDPIEEDGGLNLYAYCGGDPVNFVDTLGLSSVAVVYAADKQDTFLVADGVNFMWGANNGSHDFVLKVSSIKDTIEKLRALRERGIVIDDLFLYDHGAPGIQRLGTSAPGTPDSLVPTEEWKTLANNLSSSGTIHLMGCNVADGTDGKDYLLQLAAVANRRVTGATGETAHPSFFQAILYMPSRRTGNLGVATPDGKYTSTPLRVFFNSWIPGKELKK